MGSVYGRRCLTIKVVADGCCTTAWQDLWGKVHWVHVPSARCGHTVCVHQWCGVPPGQH